MLTTKPQQKLLWKAAHVQNSFIVWKVNEFILLKIGNEPSLCQTQMNCFHGTIFLCGVSDCNLPKCLLACRGSTGFRKATLHWKIPLAFNIHFRIALGHGSVSNDTWKLAVCTSWHLCSQGGAGEKNLIIQQFCFTRDHAIS